MIIVFVDLCVQRLGARRATEEEENNSPHGSFRMVGKFFWSSIVTINLNAGPRTIVNEESVGG